jgi:hypothetical protein
VSNVRTVGRPSLNLICFGGGENTSSVENNELSKSELIESERNPESPLNEVKVVLVELDESFDESSPSRGRIGIRPRK